MDSEHTEQIDSRVVAEALDPPSLHLKAPTVIDSTCTGYPQTHLYPHH